MVLIGILVWINGLTIDVKTAFQQTVQWLEYVLGFMLICTGVICNYLGRILDIIKENSKKEIAEKKRAVKKRAILAIFNKGFCHEHMDT